MSTRCQVVVIGKGMGNEDRITLYHHTDGYPSYMIPLINKARKFKGEYTSEWEKGRVGKVASFLCAVDPGVFEPEDGHDLHDDIEYYYKLYVINHRGGALAEKPTWEVEVLTPKNGFWDNPTEENMMVGIPLSPLESIKIKED